MTIKEFIAKYGTEGWRLPIEEFIRRAPFFKTDAELAGAIGEFSTDLQRALEDVAAPD